MNYSLVIDGDFLFEKLSQLKERKNLILEVNNGSVVLHTIENIETKKKKNETIEGKQVRIRKKREILKNLVGIIEGGDLDWKKAKDEQLVRQ